MPKQFKSSQHSPEKNEQHYAPESPCVRNCCLNNNDICVGCYRHLDEIMAWQQSSPTEKKQILKRCLDRQNNL